MFNEDKKVFKSPVSILEDDINKLFDTKKVEDHDFLFNILNLLLLKKEKNTDMIDLFKLLGIDNFVNILHLFDGREIKFSKPDEFLDNLLLAICYYERVIHKKDWKEIQDTFPSYRIEKLSMALKIHGLDQFIKQKIQQLYREWKKEYKEKDNEKRK